MRHLEHAEIVHGSSLTVAVLCACSGLARTGKQCLGLTEFSLSRQRLPEQEFDFRLEIPSPFADEHILGFSEQPLRTRQFRFADKPARPQDAPANAVFDRFRRAQRIEQRECSVALTVLE